MYLIRDLKIGSTQNERLPPGKILWSAAVQAHIGGKDISYNEDELGILNLIALLNICTYSMYAIMIQEVLDVARSQKIQNFSASGTDSFTGL